MRRALAPLLALLLAWGLLAPAAAQSAAAESNQAIAPGDIPARADADAPRNTLQPKRIP